MKNKVIHIILLILLIVSVVAATVFGCWRAGLIKENKDENSSSISYHADTMDEINSLKQHKKPMIIAFGADYCPTCVNYKPYIKELNAKYGNDVIIKYIDTVEHEAIRKEYNIELIPSTLFFDKNGNPFRPGDDVEVFEPEEFDGERKHVSDNIKTVAGAVLGLNNNFEYGVDNKSDELVYCKYADFIDMVQLEKIVEKLLQN